MPAKYLFVLLIMTCAVSSASAQGFEDFTSPATFEIGIKRNEIESYKRFDTLTIGEISNKEGVLAYVRNDTLFKIESFTKVKGKMELITYYLNDANPICVAVMSGKINSTDSAWHIHFDKHNASLLARYYYVDDKLVAADIRDKKRLTTKTKDAATYLELHREHLLDYFNRFH